MTKSTNTYPIGAPNVGKLVIKEKPRGSVLFSDLKIGEMFMLDGTLYVRHNITQGLAIAIGAICGSYRTIDPALNVRRITYIEVTPEV